MKNKDFYKDEIVRIACNGRLFGLFDGKLGQCPKHISDYCNCCDFHKGCQSCDMVRAEWAESEHIEYEVDWTKVPVDTPIKVWNEGWTDDQHEPRHFSKYENGRVYAWVNGRTSFTMSKCIDRTHQMNAAWDYVELAEPHPEWMKVKEAK